MCKVCQKKNRGWLLFASDEMVGIPTKLSDIIELREIAKIY